MTTFAMTVTCASKRGIVAAISSYLAEMGCNIIDSSQFDDRETGCFFMRVSFVSEKGKSLESLREGFSTIAGPFRIEFNLYDESRKFGVISWSPDLGTA